MIPTFAQGDKVVCVWDWTVAQMSYDIIFPKLGEVYTLRQIINPEPGVADYYSVLLHEISNPVEPHAPHEPSFNADAFLRVTGDNVIALLSALSSNRRN